MRRGRRARSWAIALLLISWTRWTAPALPPETGSTASTDGPKKCYSAEEVREILDEVKAAAREEIERSVAEAAKAAAIAYLPQVEAAKSLADSWEAECKRIKAEAFMGKLKVGAGSLVIGVCLGATAVALIGGIAR
jgi:hypothetical protein